MFLRKSDRAIPYFQNKIYMRLGLVITVIGILILGVYSPLFDYIFELSSNLN